MAAYSHFMDRGYSAKVARENIFWKEIIEW